jgi:hypothetical protein
VETERQQRRRRREEETREMYRFLLFHLGFLSFKGVPIFPFRLRIEGKEETTVSNGSSR